VGLSVHFLWDVLQKIIALMMIRNKIKRRILRNLILLNSAKMYFRKSHGGF